MSVALQKGMTLAEFLDWEERQELRYEFDGFQPVAMTGGTLRHEAIGERFAPCCMIACVAILVAPGARTARSKCTDAFAIRMRRSVARRDGQATQSCPRQLSSLGP